MVERLQLNLRLDGHKDLLLEVKDAALKQGLSVNQFVIEALRLALAQSANETSEASYKSEKLDSRLEKAIAHSVEWAIREKLDEILNDGVFSQKLGNLLDTTVALDNPLDTSALDNPLDASTLDNPLDTPLDISTALDTPLDTSTALDTPQDLIKDRYVIGLLHRDGGQIDVIGYWHDAKKGFLPDLKKAKGYIGEANVKRAVSLISKRIQLGDNQRLSYKLLSELR